MADTVSPETLAEWRDTRDDVFILDIRPEEEFSDRAIPGSENFPVYRYLKSGETEPLIKRLDEIPEGQTVVTVCRAGVVAQIASEVLTEHGINAVSLDGGIRGWVDMADAE